MNKTKDLYFIENCGCDATTYGLVELDNNEFSKFKEFVLNLNKNSYYGCMPKINIYKANINDLKDVTGYDPENVDIFDDGYIDREKLFYMDDKTYTFKDEYFRYYSEWEEIVV